MNMGDEIKEQLLIKQSGYLRVPKAISQKVGTSPRNYPQPDADFKEDEETFTVSFTFKKKDIGGNGSG